MDESRTFFVFGPPKSGTTWVQLLLDGHAAIACRAEDEFGFLLERFLEALTRYNKLLLAVDARTACQQPTLFDESDAVALLRAAVLRAFGRALAAPGVRVAGAKDNGMLKRVQLLAGLFPRSRLVLVLRDPRDVIVSSWFHNLRVEPGFRERAGDLARWCEQGARTWRTDLDAALAALEPLGERVHVVRYERLHEAPAATVARLLDHLGADASGDAVAACLEAADFRRLSGGRPPGQEDRGSFFRRGEPGDWRRHLDRDMIARVDAEAGPLMQRFGYTA